MLLAFVVSKSTTQISFGGQITLWQADVFAYICQVTLSNGAVSPNTQHKQSNLWHHTFHVTISKLNHSKTNPKPQIVNVTLHECTVELRGYNL